MTAWGSGPSGTGRRARPLLSALAALLLVALVAVPALADFGDFDHPDDQQRPEPGESPRRDTPNDLEFDRCEQDDPDTPEGDCFSYFNEQFGSFGFNPDSANEPTAPGARTNYDDCSQLNGQGQEANTDSGDPRCAQLAGVRADSAWKYSIGDPETVVAILDTGIEWQNEELVEKVNLNERELPVPRIGGSALVDGADCAGSDPDEPDYLPRPERGDPYDANGDGAVNAHDYACDQRVGIADGDTESDGILDPSDLIANPEFSDDTDADGNGYVDDIAGWDFFDDDNDPFDASSCCSAGGHGTGRALEAAAETDNGEDATGMCPDCQVMPLRVWDSFVVDTNLYSLGLVYAADNGASVAEGAVGGLLNSQFARRAFSYADRRGLALMLVSSDINSANHNYPTNYDEAVYVAGSMPDSAPSDCVTPSPPVGDFPNFELPGCVEFFQFLSRLPGGVAPDSPQVPTTSFFRNSNLTQYGGKADIVLMGSTGSENTGQAAGAAGLLASYGRQELRKPLTGNEIRQLLTMTAEDVLPQNTGQIGAPDRAERGWDTHFGYGRVNLAGAMERIRRDRIPPEAQLDAPDWFTPINVDRVPARGVTIYGRAAAPHGAVGSWELEYACGQDARDASFRPVPVTFGGGGAVEGPLGRLPRSTLEELARDCDGSVENDPGRPAGRQIDAWPADPYPKPDPERHAFQVRLTVHEAGDPRNVGVYRKTLFAYRDDGNRPGWPKPIGSGSRPNRLVTGAGGETPTRLVDLNGDNRLDVLLGTSSGELFALDARGEPLGSFNEGRPVTTRPYAPARRHDPPGSLAFEPREPLRAPAVGDLDGDGEPEIVATAGEHVYAWDRHGDPVPGFPARVDPDLSEPCVDGVQKPCFDAGDRAITSEHHIKRGFFGSAALVDLDGHEAGGDDALEIVAGSLDQHVYAFDGDGSSVDSFNNGQPRELDGDGDPATGAEIVTSPAVGDVDDSSEGPEIVIATNEVEEGGDPPDVPQELEDFFAGQAGSNVVYALQSDGENVGGQWPVRIGTLAGDILPLVVPSHDAAIVDADENPADDEVVVSAATGDAQLLDGDGSTRTVFNNNAAASPNVADHGMQLNLADYPSIGELLVGEGPAVVKAGISLNGVLNLLAVNQNLPFNHSVQAWSVFEGDSYLPAFPVATDDFQLVSQPAIAKVDDLGGEAAGPSAQGVPTPSRHALVGTGLYQLHAYDLAGREPGGTRDERWPKFLGGWVQPTPAVGDVDGDGKLEVSAVTREGWSFVWDTTADACQEGVGPASLTTNQEWWTFGHDEFGSHNYETDARPPSRPGPLDVTEVANDLELSFVASGDDLLCGTPERYEARGSNQPIRTGEDFQDAEPLDITAQPIRPGGERQDAVVDDGGAYRFVAIRAVDDAGNVSYVRSASTVEEDDGGGGDPSGGGGDPPAGEDPPGRGANPAPGGSGDAAPAEAAGGGGAAGDPVAGDDGGAGSGGAAGAAAAESTVPGARNGALPFTGLGLALLVLTGLLLLSAGFYARRRAARS